MKKLFIFDFDGTLVNTITDAAICFNKALECYGFRTYPIEDYGRLVGGNLETIFSRLLDSEYRTSENILKLKNTYRQIYLEDTKVHTKPFDGMEEVLKNLISRGYKVAISTNKAQVLVDKLCNDFFSDINFNGIIGYDDRSPSKPDPYSVNKLMTMNKVTKEETVYVGDGLTDVMTAQNAGVDCIFVLWGQGDKELINHEAITFVASSVQDVIAYANN